jgi:hypothetical protein
MLQAEVDKIASIESETASLEALAEEMNINCNHETHVKEHLNDASSNGVLPLLLDGDESEVSDTPQGDDGDGASCGRPEHRATVAKKTKKKKAKRKRKTK